MCRGPGGAGGEASRRRGAEGTSCPMGETGLGTRMQGVGRCLGGLGAWSPGTRGACRIARRREGRAGLARFRPRPLPPASFLSASRQPSLPLAAFPPSPPSVSPRLCSVLLATLQPPPRCHGRCISPRPAVSEPQPGADPHLPPRSPPGAARGALLPARLRPLS